MSESRRWCLADLTALLLVLALAGGVRAWYVAVCTDAGNEYPQLEVEGQAPRWFPTTAAVRAPRQSTELDELVHNLDGQRGFASVAPLAGQEEPTAHIAPAYPWLVSLAARLDMPRDVVVRWAQAVLGTLTVLCYFCFARRAFQSLAVGFLTGLLCALHPFWIVNTAELTDGVLATFLLGACLMLGTRASQSGGAFLSLLYGLTLAGLAMTRAALLPFALVALLWFLLSCRALRAGWLCALLAVLGFGNGLAPWGVRNFREFGEVMPVVDSAMLHHWVGNNPRATGGPLDERSLRASLPPERLQALLAEPNQARRYESLGQDVIREVVNDPGATIGRRLWAGLMFVFGENWFTAKTLSRTTLAGTATSPPEWVTAGAEGAVHASILVMIVLGLLGWRFSFGWRKQARLATLAAVWVPLPYLLTHADYLSGPRLPLDGVWLCFAAVALACFMSGMRREPE
jgi:4-amino-4-deoxy-L-arabinose transferase-like glycosyltransferase